MKVLAQALAITLGGVAALFVFTALITYLSSVDDSGWTSIAVFAVGMVLFSVCLYRVFDRVGRRR